MILLPVVISVIWIAVASRRSDAPLLPTTRVGQVALASLVLLIVVAVTGASLAATVPIGIVMLVLASFSRWAKRDRGLLLVLPLVFGLTVLVLPLVFE